jgi:uncharacterized glyoxalase superfamily protein PhnB
MATRPRKRASAKARPRRPARPARRLRERRQPETLRLRSITPGYTVTNLEKSIAFYTEVLGFIVGERMSEGGRLMGATLKAGACELWLAQDDWAKGRDRKKGQGVRIWCETIMDIDALAMRARKAGIALAEGPKDQPWGVRSFAVDDPDGYHLTIFRQK